MFNYRTFDKIFYMIVVTGAAGFIGSALVTFLNNQGYENLMAARDVSAIFGNANFALLLSTVIAMGLLFTQRNLSFAEMAKVVEVSLMSGGVIS